MSPGFNPSNEPETGKKHRFPDPRSEFFCQSLQRSESDLPARAGESCQRRESRMRADSGGGNPRALSLSPLSLSSSIGPAHPWVFGPDKLRS